MATVLRPGAHHLDAGQRPEEEHVVLADPEGNEFCVIEPGNNFLAGCGYLGRSPWPITRVGITWQVEFGEGSGGAEVQVVGHDALDRPDQPEPVFAFHAVGFAQ